MQSAPPFATGTAWVARHPSSSIATSSPGATSRTYSAATRSSAQVSEATTQSSWMRPRQSGRKPNGSRKASSVPSESATTEKAPSSFRIVLATASSSGASSEEIRAAITSVSEVEPSLTPRAASSSRSFAVFVRLPLWPSATVLARPWWTSGCAFDQCVEPVVE